MEGPIKGLVITLKRGLAGSREQHRAVLRSLGLFRRQQVVIQPNTSSIRGALEKIKHMVIVETDQMYVQRQLMEREATIARPSLVVSHPVAATQQKQ